MKDRIIHPTAEFERDQYDGLVRRLRAHLADLDALQDGAALEGDEQTIWFCQAARQQAENQLRTLRKPGEPRR